MIPMVSIVGAGPGDPELLTLKAARRLTSADIILYDSLVGDDIVTGLPETARVIDVGKRPDGNRTSQDTINRRMIDGAKRGHAIVRLKGGDPTIFGRGGEEAEALAQAGVPFEFVPGVSSAVAGPQTMGIPLTHREHASHVTIITGHEDPTKEESALNWEALAANIQSGGTLVILMGVGRVTENIAALVTNGVQPSTSVAITERCTLPGEFSITGTLDSIETRIHETGVRPPAVMIVGNVVDVGTKVQGLLGNTPAQGTPTPLISKEVSLTE